MARRSMAYETASRTFWLSKGGFLRFMMMLSVTLVLNGVTMSFGTAALSCSAAALVVSPGMATSSWPACSAAVRVPRSLMTMYFSPSR
jgi:hypothetical protein